jgi:hypothetical protein
MNRIKLLLLSLIALVFSAPIGFRTANVKPDPNTGPLPGEEAPAPDSEVGLLIKGAGVDWKDVTWRIRAGLTAKQAVEVALNEKREADGQQPNELSAVEKEKLAKGESIADAEAQAAADQAAAEKAAASKTAPAKKTAAKKTAAKKTAAKKTAAKKS